MSRKSLRRALRAWDSVGALGAHPLTVLGMVEARHQIAGYSDTPAGRGLALREVLRAALEAIRPADEMPDPAKKHWRPYIILTEQYLRGRTPNWVASELSISERTYYEEQERALQALADILHQWEEKSQVALSSGSECLAPFLAPPCPAHTLVGRDGLLSDLKRRLLEKENILIVLQGLPGVGKTALAIELANDPDIQEHFCDGVLWAGMGRRPDVLALLGAWAGALRVSAEEIARCSNLTERAWRLHAAIGPRRMLLVIDDAWQVEAALTLKVGGPHCAYIVTSRLVNVAADLAGKASVPVHELDMTEGINLLAQLAPQVVCAEPDETRALVQAVGGLPLALILMGRRLRQVSCGAQERRVREALVQLQAAQARLQLAQPLSPLEQQADLTTQTSLSLQVSIGLSDAALDAAAQQALQDLSLFPPKPSTFSETAALAVTDAPANVLDMLADHGFLESAGPGRYTMHQTIADYARFTHEARLEEPDSEAVQRFVEHFVQYIIEHAAESDLLELERDNLLAALELAFSCRMCGELVRGVKAVHPFLITRGLYAVVERQVSHALELMPEANEVERYTLLMAREKAYDVLGKREAQRQDLDTLEKLAEALNDSSRRTQVALRWANYAMLISNYVTATVAAQRAIELGRTAHDVGIQAEGHLQWGRALCRQGEYTAARAQLEQALTLARKASVSGSTDLLLRLEAESLLNLGNVMYHQGHYVEAKPYYGQSLCLYREQGDPRGESMALNNLGLVSNAQGDYAGAQTYYEQSLRIKREIGDRWGESIVLNNLGLIFVGQGDYAKAQARYEQSLYIRREIGDRSGESMSLGNLGHAFLDQGDVIKAQSYYERSLGISREVGDRRVECVTMVNLGLLFHRMGDNETARQYSQQALRVAKDIDARERQGDSLTNLGHALAGLGQWTEAAVAYQDALDIWRELGRYNLAMEPLAGLVRISLAQDDLALARTQVEEILRHLEIGALDGTEEPFRVYLTCYQALKANADPRAQDILSTAYNLLQARAAKISDEQVRRSFLENVLTHRELIAAWLTL